VVVGIGKSYKGVRAGSGSVGERRGILHGRTGKISVVNRGSDHGG